MWFKRLPVALEAESKVVYVDRSSRFGLDVNVGKSRQIKNPSYLHLTGQRVSPTRVNERSPLPFGETQSLFRSW